MCKCNMKRLHFGVNYGIERERCLSIGWVWSIRANAGCHEHREIIDELASAIRIERNFC